MAVFYWHNEGRLGNLLFQYFEILECTSINDRVIAFHNDVFDLVKRDARFIVINGRGKFFEHLNFRMNQLSSWATTKGFVGLIQPQYDLTLGLYKTESESVLHARGRIKSFSVVRGFFQYARRCTQRLALKSELLEKGRKRLFEVTRGRISVAVHLRLTDYGTWTVYGRPGVLIPTAWFRARIEELRQRLDAPVFIVFSDDSDSVKALDLGADVVLFNGVSGIEDFAVMSLCEHAVISPSSFAWWSVLSSARPNKIIIAPTFWAGFKSDVWYPPTMATANIEYFPVQS